jgi:hypothetical protein
VTPEKIWRVFLNQETGTHIVLHKQERVSGHRVVFGPETLDACLGWVNSKGAGRPHQNYSVFRNRNTDTLLVLSTHMTSFDVAPVYGPETFDRCLEFARLNSSNPQPGLAQDGSSENMEADRGNYDCPAEGPFLVARERNRQ